MNKRKFRRFVAVFVGILLVFDVVCSILLKDESLILSSFVLGLLYTVYLVLFFKKEKQEKADTRQRPQSPLMR